MGIFYTVVNHGDDNGRIPACEGGPYRLDIDIALLAGILCYISVSDIDQIPLVRKGRVVKNALILTFLGFYRHIPTGLIRISNTIGLLPGHGTIFNCRHLCSRCHGHHDCLEISVFSQRQTVPTVKAKLLFKDFLSFRTHEKRAGTSHLWSADILKKSI